MTIRYFEKIKKRIAKLEWLIERESIDTEYDEDADIGNIGGSIVFKDGSVLHFKEIVLGEKKHYRFHYMDERNNLISRWDNAPHHKDLGKRTRLFTTKCTKDTKKIIRMRIM